MNFARRVGSAPRQSQLTIFGHMTDSRRIARPEIASLARCSETFREVERSDSRLLPPSKVREALEGAVAECPVMTMIERA